tara:strand:+ start:771 stop:1097 length:327 start_codon:yes stop_codon:yes gene_type:complete
MKEEALSVSIASLAPIYEGAASDRSLSELYLEHYFKSEHPNPQAITNLILANSLAASQCDAIEAFIRDSEGTQVTIYPSEIKALAVSALSSERVKFRLSKLNISFFLH